MKCSIIILIISIYKHLDVKKVWIHPFKKRYVSSNDDTKGDSISNNCMFRLLNWDKCMASYISSKPTESQYE